MTTEPRTEVSGPVEVLRRPKPTTTLRTHKSRSHCSYPNPQHAHPYLSYRTMTRQLFWPPNPKLFFSATFTSALRASFGT